MPAEHPGGPPKRVCGVDPGRRRRILIVEDSLLVQRMIREFFEAMGFEVLVAGNGREALEHVREFPPEVIISDIVMPVMDGWEFCEKVRGDADTAGIPFLFVTAVREVPERVRALRMGADDYITKPFSEEELLARVERILARVERLRLLETQGDAVLTGHTSHLSITDLFQLLCLNGKSGVVRMRDPGDAAGEVFLRDGRIVHAVLPPVEGHKALFRLLEWEESRFELDPVGVMPERETIAEDTAGLLMDALTHNDEMREARARLPPLTARFRAPESVHADARRLDLDAAAASVLAEFVGPASLQEALDRSALADRDVGRILLRLLEHRLLLSTD